MKSTDDNRIVNNVVRHEYKVLSPEEKLAMKAIKDAGLSFLNDLDKYVHPGREKSLAITKIEEAVMWAVKSITA